MSQLLQVATRTGVIPAVDGTAAPLYVDQGIPYDAGGLLALHVDGTVDHYHQGLPFTAAGRLVGTATAPTHFGSGAAPMASILGSSMLSGRAGGANHYSVGIPYSVSSGIAVDSGGDTPPFVESGGPYTGGVGQPIALNGTVVAGTYPVTGTLWTIQSGGAGVFSDDSIVDPTFTPSGSGSYVLTLTATPSVGAPVSDNANLTSGDVLPTLYHIWMYGQSLSLGSVPTGASLITTDVQEGHYMLSGGIRSVYDDPTIFNPNSSVRPEMMQSLSPLLEKISPNDGGFGETYASGMSKWLGVSGVFTSTGRGAYRVEQLRRNGDGQVAQAYHFANTYAAGLFASEKTDSEVFEYTPGVIMFKQGEADAIAGNTGPYWEAEVTLLRNELAEHLHWATLKPTSDIIMLVDQQASQQTGQTYGQIAVAAINLHRTPNNFILCAGPTYTESFDLNNSDVHMTSLGYRNYGERLGRIIEIIRTTGDWNPLYITSVSRAGTTITVNVNVPVPPMVLDTSIVSPVTNNGFAYIGANITNVAITDATNGVIEITLDAAVAGTLQFAFENGDGSGFIGPQRGSRGNFRDSEPAVTELDSSPLHNWLCNDSWEVA